MDIMEKKIDDLTVGDSLKLQLGILGVTAGIAVAVMGAAAAYEKVSSIVRIRRAKQDIKEVAEG